MKKFFGGFLVVILLVAFLSACGNDDKGGEGSGGNSDTITVWAMGEEGKLLKEMAKGFEEENEGLTVEVQALPWENAHDKLLTAVASGNGPDVLQLGATWIPEFAEAGALLDLSDYVTDNPEFAKVNYFDGAQTLMEYNDETVGIPWYVDTRVLYYRTDILAEVGYDEAPKNWEELEDAAQKLADRGDGQWGIDIDQKDQITPFIFAWQNGYQADIENNDLNLDSPEFLGAMEYYTSFFENGYSQQNEGLDIIQAFADGSKAMFFSGPWMINQLNDQVPDIEGDWSVATMPGNTSNTSSLGGSVFSVFHTSDNVDNAMKFISYMNETETQIEWMEMSNALPARVEAWDDPALSEDEKYSVFGEQLNDAIPGIQVEEFERIAQELLNALERVNVGGADLEAEMETFNQTAQQLLE
ncbi:sugar ABC transporter substrate-binding protein [Oceanobacillus sp. FSL K6-3682]|uniref:sugar ABC transporter substrate-binding protein n=1 Tax=Oceanobacillus sp. FSL K6-3682 TaxID=2921503 RepID=UPI0030DD1EA7